MGEFFGDIFTWVESLSPLYAYLVIVGISYGENIVPPVPGDMIIVFGGYLAGASDLNFFVDWLLATLGGVAGFMTMYAFGARNTTKRSQQPDHEKVQITRTREISAKNNDHISRHWRYDIFTIRNPYDH